MEKTKSISFVTFPLSLKNKRMDYWGESGRGRREKRRERIWRRKSVAGRVTSLI